jgi:hypothetical protein
MSQEAIQGNGGVQLTSLADLNAVITPQKRVVHWFDVPVGLVAETGIQKIGLVELTSGEEMTATRRSHQDPIALAFELAKESVRWVNDTPVNTADGTADSFWARQQAGTAKLRQCILAAYGVVHNPTHNDLADFLKSRRQAVR